MDENGAVIAVTKNGEWKFSEKSGIAPLMDFLSGDAEFLRGAKVADRVVGRAAAMLMIYGGVTEVFAMLISDHAIDTLSKNNIPFSYDKKTEYILNRTKDGGCPMEQSCIGVDDPAQAYAVLKAKIAEMRAKAK